MSPVGVEVELVAAVAPVHGERRVAEREAAEHDAAPPHAARVADGFTRQPEVGRFCAITYLQILRVFVTGMKLTTELYRTCTMYSDIDVFDERRADAVVSGTAVEPLVRPRRCSSGHSGASHGRVSVAYFTRYIYQTDSRFELVTFRAPLRPGHFPSIGVFYSIYSFTCIKI